MTSSGAQVDILVLGSTGLTGRLITRYLLQHPESQTFRLGISGRDLGKVEKMLGGLGIDIPTRPEVFLVDVTKQGDVDNAVAKAKVVINTCGPYWDFGRPVVAACVKHKRHYLDLAGDVAWVRQMISQFHEQAKADGTYVVHCCGFDSIPSELGPFLALKTLKTFSSDAQLGESVTSIRLQGGMTSGVLNALMDPVENTTKEEYQEATADFSLSPIKGNMYRKPQVWYTLQDPETKRNRIGNFWPMKVVNKYMVQRDWGLFEQDEDLSLHYGPKFTYDEFMENNSRILSVLTSIPLGLFFFATSRSQIVRNVVRKIFPDQIGLEDENLEKGWFEYVNITRGIAAGENKKEKQVVVKTVLKGKGDPGYLGTSVMIAEGALVALKGEGRGRAGVSTTLAAFGNGMVDRLQKTGRFEFQSRVIV
ncbi:Saccharopine dehydrogenase-domain-containing protein [Flagelloscypha sp. PMI_526]|nr:Saccharopine dehydrogenase-domain-containing protein [Flagelloscypha sp. PMI_526]